MHNSDDEWSVVRKNKEIPKIVLALLKSSPMYHEDYFELAIARGIATLVPKSHVVLRLGREPGRHFKIGNADGAEMNLTAFGPNAQTNYASMILKDVSYVKPKMDQAVHSPLFQNSATANMTCSLCHLLVIIPE